MHSVSIDNDREEVSPAEKYGVISFDLRKKAAVVEASKKYVPKSGAGIWAFCMAINELHFDGETGRLVSLKSAKQIARSCDEAHKLFEEFLKQNGNIL